ncbi:TPA: hypothetical protein QDZ88_003011 [Stenotrophomonas maltophilia]|uniref:Secreted protein n=2 Tax=Lysobacteraceae TaxID=32033 RepID=A0A2J0U3T7_STEMA|nr:hypothetical protein B9Y64_21245 [Stenotrophomonas maltophilia]HDS1148482.1 hypothetical protein [Stenotrophomonas maltophilia]HDS1162098.1 hypothetical protein [Stenotrophomonas maltophilia]
MPRYAFIRPWTIALSVATLCACAHAADRTPTSQGTDTMAPSVSETTPPSLDAGQLLLRLLDLIKTTTSTRDLTAERLSAAMQAPAQTFGPGHFGYGGTLTPEWGYGLELKRAGAADARLDLNFIDTSAGRKASAAAICQIDFNHFASALDAAGFKRQTVRGEHGRVIHERFNRPQLSIKVDTMPENPNATGDATHACVRLVTVQ